MANFVKVATKLEIADGEIKKVNVDGQEIAIFNLAGEFFALSDVCTHEGCHLSEEGQVEGGQVECMCHGSKFEIKTGEVVMGPAFEPMQNYEVKVEGDDVLVEV